MKPIRPGPLQAVVVSVMLCAVPAAAASVRCPPDSVKVGLTCVDKYKASVWQIDPRNIKLVRKIQAGTVTLTDLNRAGAKELGLAVSECYLVYPDNFPRDGNWAPIPGSNPPSPGVYAVSIPGVVPSGCISWFQANQACLLSGKRLLTNREWQGAASGTPDPGVADDRSTTCPTLTAEDVKAGSRSACKSNWGVFDMVGGLGEWVADWADPANQPCTDWYTAVGVSDGDLLCFGGTESSVDSTPAALIRSGQAGKAAGVFAVDATTWPSYQGGRTGFRCAR